MLLKTAGEKPQEIGKRLVGFALDPADIEAATDELSSTIPVDKSTVEYELRFLRVFAVDFGITLGLRGKQKEKEIISAFYFRTLNSFIGDLPGELKARFETEIESKFDSYGLILKANAADDSFRAIGELFSNHCGVTDSNRLTEYGMEQFITTANGVSEYLKNIGITA